ncbi:MAG: lactate utilization protein [Oscillospiraceae bacterium]|nr:lactate utilization protein [Oscillospiraceae bacterium]
MANVELTMKNLEKRGFCVSRFPDRTAAAEYLLQEVGDSTVGIGGSMTIGELDIYDRLAARGEVFWQAKAEGDVAAVANAAPVYLMSANGVSESGLIINIDGRSNRVVNAVFGTERLYMIIGINKIAPTDEMALWRARNIAAPKNAKRLGKKTPCAVEGDKCYDCDSPERICRSFVHHERKPGGVPHFEVIIVDEALGL